MNKKLLCSTALAGAMILSGSAFAELKVGGNFTHTTNFGSDESGSTATGSNEYLGTEMNLALSSKKDLDNGMYAQYKGKVEFDSVGAAPDVEYEFQIGTENAYLGFGSDAGNNISSSPTLPAVGYHVGSLAINVSSSEPANYDGLINGGEANNESHVSLNAKVAGGTASVIYTPNVSETDNDSQTVTTSASGSALAMLYSGSPMENVKFIIGRSEEKGTLDTAANEKTNDKVGISYNFGQFNVGYEYQTYETGDDSAEEKADNFAVTYAASDAVTVGLQYSKHQDEKTANANDEEITALSVGYNLGGASVALSFVDVENLGSSATDGVDSQGVVITTKFGF